MQRTMAMVNDVGITKEEECGNLQETQEREGFGALFSEHMLQ